MDQHKPERLLRSAGGTVVAGSSSMRLCAGTLVVDQPDQVLLDYLDVRNGYAYPAYDRLRVTATPALFADLKALLGTGCLPSGAGG